MDWDRTARVSGVSSRTMALITNHSCVRLYELADRKRQAQRPQPAALSHRRAGAHRPPTRHIDELLPWNSRLVAGRRRKNDRGVGKQRTHEEEVVRIGEGDLVSTGRGVHLEICQVSARDGHSEQLAGSIALNAHVAGVPAAR